MNSIEIFIVVVLVCMTVPDLCRRAGRPALAFPAFVGLGLLVSPLLDPAVRVMLHQAGRIGFLLLLFEVGLDIDLPGAQATLRALRRAAAWSLAQWPLLVPLAVLAGLGPLETAVAVTALTSCSVGMAYPAWKAFALPDESQRQSLLHWMIALEVLAVLLLAGESVILARGWSGWILLRLAGITLVIFGIARLSPHLQHLFHLILGSTTRWRTHLLVLLILFICAIGQRLGLDAPKTAFFLGLFMSGLVHEGRHLEEIIAPVSRGFLIPLFFVALGTQVEWGHLPWTHLATAVLGGIVLAGAREVIHRRLLPTGAGADGHLLLGPNLTLAALAADILLARGGHPASAMWILLLGLTLTLLTVLRLPRAREG